MKEEIKSEPDVKNEEESMEVYDEEEEQEVEEDGKEPVKPRVCLPGYKLGEEEVLEPDPSAYIMLHEASPGSIYISLKSF